MNTSTLIAPVTTATETRRIVYFSKTQFGDKMPMVVPEESPRRMPEQPLGELYSAANPQLWLSSFRTVSFAMLSWAARLRVSVIGSVKSD